MTQFYLITENFFHTSYLTSRWCSLKHLDHIKGIVIRDEKDEEQYQRRLEFHQSHQGKCSLTTAEKIELFQCYGQLSLAEEAMIQLFGVPALPHIQNTEYIGKDINGDLAHSWLKSRVDEDSQIRLLVFLDKLFAPWWMNMTHGTMLNVHSAVLPHARGFYAVENIACLGDITAFKKAVGATAHYIDEGIDTGSIVCARRLNDPFQLESIWEVKAYCYKLAFDLLIELAQSLSNDLDTHPVGIQVDPSIDSPVFFYKNFTKEVRSKAQEQFLKMKKQVMNGSADCERN